SHDAPFLTVFLCAVFFLLLLRLPPSSTLFPYTTLFRSIVPTTPTSATISSRVLAWIVYPAVMTLAFALFALLQWSGAPLHWRSRSEEHTSELQSPYDLVCRLLLEKKKENRTSEPRLPSY